MVNKKVQYVVLAALAIGLLWFGVIGPQDGYLCLGDDGHIGIKANPDNHCIGPISELGDDLLVQEADADQIGRIPYNCGQCSDIPLVSIKLLLIVKSNRIIKDACVAVSSPAWVAAAEMSFLTAKLLPTDMNNTMPEDVANSLCATILLS